MDNSMEPGRLEWFCVWAAQVRFVEFVTRSYKWSSRLIDYDFTMIVSLEKEVEKIVRMDRSDEVRGVCDSFL